MLYNASQERTRAQICNESCLTMYHHEQDDSKFVLLSFIFSIINSTGHPKNAPFLQSMTKTRTTVIQCNKIVHRRVIVAVFFLRHYSLQNINNLNKISL